MKLLFMSLCSFAPSDSMRLALQSHLASVASVTLNKFTAMDEPEDTAVHCWERLHESRMTGKYFELDINEISQITVIDFPYFYHIQLPDIDFETQELVSFPLIVVLDDKDAEIFVPSIPGSIRKLIPMAQRDPSPCTAQDLCFELKRRYKLDYVGKLEVPDAPPAVKEDLEDGRFLRGDTLIYQLLMIWRDFDGFTPKWILRR